MKWAFGWKRRRWERQMDAEFQFHLDTQINEYVRQGLSREDAEARARREFGGVELAKEECRDERILERLDHLLRDVRYAFRSLRKSPAYAIAAIVTLALGIGTNTAIFSALEGAVLAPLPYREPDRLVTLFLYNRSLQYPTYLSYPDFLDWQRSARSFEQMAAFKPLGFDMTSPGTPEHVEGKEVSANYFDTLGVGLAMGRAFSALDDKAGGKPAVVISHRLWREHFASEHPAHSAIGRSITLGGTGYTIAGVLRPGFRFGDKEADVYTPIGRGDPTIRQDRTIHNVLCIARLGRGVPIGQARAELSTIQEHIDELNPLTERGQETAIDPLKHYLVGDIGGTLFLLLGAVGLVLLIACANVANLLLARATARTREFAVRRALGASRMQVVQQLITESVLVSSAGGLLGLLLAKWGLSVVLAAVPGSLPRSENIGLNVSVLLFALGVSVAVGILFGIVPALKQSRADLQSGLKEGGRGNSGRHNRTQGALAVVQIALALILLSGASLLFRTIHNLWAVNPGFDAQHVVTFQVGLSPAVTRTGEGIRVAYQQLAERIRQIPGVQDAAVTALLPLSQNFNSGPFWVGSQRPSVSMAQIPRAMYYPTGPDYLRTMKIPLLRGRVLGPADNPHSTLVVLIDSLMARTYFPDRDPLGQTIGIPHWGADHDVAAQIVGVVGHVEHSALDGSGSQQPQIYFSLYQLPDDSIGVFRGEMSLVVRTPLDDAMLLPAIKKVVYGVGSNQPIYNMRSMPDLVTGSIARQRFPMLLLGAFAVLALLLASVGIYGVLSYSTAQRLPEFGIRLALGATKRDVLQMLIWQGLRLVLVGIAIGALAALVLSQVLSSFSRLLYGVRASDPFTFTVVSLCLLVTALLACYVPARRAARTDPMVALRHD